MSDLISRRALLKDIELSMSENPHTDTKIRANHNREHQHFLFMVYRQPFAYDIEKIVKHLENIEIDDSDMIYLSEAIEIVKGCGLDQ